MAAPLAAALALAILYTQARRRLRRRGRPDLAGPGRALLLAAALALWLLAFSPPVDQAADRLLAAHMLEHLLIGDAIPALLLTALRGPILFFLLPPPLLRPLSRLHHLRRLATLLLRPGTALTLWAISFGLWHIPALYDQTLTNPALHLLEHACFLLTGLLVWAQLIDSAGRRALTRQQRNAYALALFVAGQALTNTLLLTYTPLYPAYAEQPHRLYGLTALADQDAAGLLMLAEQAATLGTYATIQLRRWLARPLPPAARTHPLAL